jgi:hypothetical protein
MRRQGVSFLPAELEMLHDFVINHGGLALRQRAATGARHFHHHDGSRFPWVFDQAQAAPPRPVLERKSCVAC